MDLEHRILILDANLKQNLVFDKHVDITTKLVEDLLHALNMKKLGKLEIYNSVDANFPGWSFIQPITTSHISGHYFEDEKQPHIHFDIYSCKKFQWKTVINILDKHLHLAEWSGNFIVRDVELAKRESASLSGIGSHMNNEN